MIYGFILLYIQINQNKYLIGVQIKQQVTYVWNLTGQQSCKYVTLYVKAIYSKCIFNDRPTVSAVLKPLRSENEKKRNVWLYVI
jgi:hypothetical protein